MRNILHLVKEYKKSHLLLKEYVKIPRDRFHPIVCYLSGQPDGKNELEPIAFEVRYLRFGKKKLRYHRFNVILPLLKMLCKIMKEEKIDIVHCHRHKATVIGTIAATIAGVPNVISHVHGLARTRSWVRRFTNWIILRRVKKIIVVSDSVGQDVINTNWGIDPSKIVTVKNGIDLKTIDNITISKREARTTLGILESEIVFGTVGRLTPTKGQSYLIDAFSRVIKKIPHSRLVIIGEGPLFGELSEKVKDLGISPKVSFTGYRDDVLQLLGGFDIFVLPSLAEGLSIALLEAMASKLPVIASNVGGIPEVFGKAHCGKLVPPKDVSALESAMLEIYFLDEEQKKMLGENARKRVEEEFKIDAMSKKLSEVYESMLN